MAETSPEQKQKLNRRGFLTGTAGAATATTVAVVAGADEAVAAESQPDKVKARYQANSKNVQNFYRVNRY